MPTLTLPIWFPRVSRRLQSAGSSSWDDSGKRIKIYTNERDVRDVVLYFSMQPLTVNEMALPLGFRTTGLAEIEKSIGRLPIGIFPLPVDSSHTEMVWGPPLLGFNNSSHPCGYQSLLYGHAHRAVIAYNSPFMIEIESETSYRLVIKRTTGDWVSVPGHTRVNNYEAWEGRVPFTIFGNTAPNHLGAESMQACLQRLASVGTPYCWPLRVSP